MFNTQRIKRSNITKSIRVLVFSLLAFGWIMQTALAISGGWMEDFNSNPTTRGWSYLGVTPTLMSWSSTAGNLQCTWDSSTSLSRYGRGVNFSTPLNQSHSFNLQFDVTFSYFSTGAYTNYPLAIGLYNSTTSANRVQDIFEWDYFLGTDSTFGGPNFLGVSVSDKDGGYSNCSGGYTFVTPAYTLQTATTYHVTMNYNGASQVMILTMTANGNSFGSFPPLNLCGVGFTVDQFAVTSWFDDTPIGFGGPANFKVNGTVDNIQLTFPSSVKTNQWMRLE